MPTRAGLAQRETARYSRVRKSGVASSPGAERTTLAVANDLSAITQDVRLSRDPVTILGEDTSLSWVGPDQPMRCPSRQIDLGFV